MEDLKAQLIEEFGEGNIVDVTPPEIGRIKTGPYFDMVSIDT
jgi:hypothetical protein